MSTIATRADAPEHPSPEPLSTCVVEEMRVLVVAGVAVGVLVAGLGSRLAMGVLRVTSPDWVVGIRSDDGFRIGQVTLGGTYNLLVLGAAVGVVGAGLYRLVRPWLIGPVWFRRLTTGAAAGAVVGSLLVHADGVDFRFLKPTWLAIGIFVALPAAFGAGIGAAVDRVGRVDSWTRRGRWGWGLPVALLIPFPMVIGVLPFVALATLVALALGRWGRIRRLLARPTVRLAVRGAWLAIAVVGLVALVGDIADVRRVT